MKSIQTEALNVYSWATCIKSGHIQIGTNLKKKKKKSSQSSTDTL